MKYPIETVHGHTHSDLEALLEDSCDAFDDFIDLESTSLGGWSNINIRGRSSGFDFVLKLPGFNGPFEPDHYEHQFKLNHLFSQLDIACHPIEFGYLSDATKTPFFLVEYIEGSTYSTIVDVSSSELLSLKESLRILKQQTPPDVPIYETPTDYLLAFHKKVKEHPLLSEASKKLRDPIEDYSRLFSKLKSRMDILGYWSRETMHGDLWVPNIIFRPEQNALFLDLEACSIGDAHYDYASLLEIHQESSLGNIPSIFTGRDINMINSLRPLALAYAIDWSLERLLSMEYGRIEPNLNTKEIRSMILDYTHDKINRLKSLIT